MTNATSKPKLYEKVGIRLTDAQVIEMGEDLAEKRLEANWLIAEKADKTTEFKATDEYKAFKEETDAIGEKIDGLNGSIDELAKQIDDREKFVDVEVREEPDDGRNMIAVVRCDTGQVIKTRAMTLNEMAESQARKRQPSLDFNGAAAAGAEAKDHEDDEDERHDTDPAPPPNGVADRPSGARPGGRKKKKASSREAHE